MRAQTSFLSTYELFHNVADSIPISLTDLNLSYAEPQQEATTKTSRPLTIKINSSFTTKTSMGMYFSKVSIPRTCQFPKRRPYDDFQGLGR